MTHLRRAGRGRLTDGGLVTWSVAEGAGGRRWRWTLATGEGSLIHAALIELDAAGSFMRLELETATGMLTLHPGPDGSTAHGNVVRADRVDPIRVAWSATSAVAFRDDGFGSALTGWSGSGWVINRDLTIGEGSLDRPTPTLDARGIPILVDANEWPLEV